MVHIKYCLNAQCVNSTDGCLMTNYTSGKQKSGYGCIVWLVPSLSCPLYQCCEGILSERAFLPCGIYLMCELNWAAVWLRKKTTAVIYPSSVIWCIDAPVFFHSYIEDFFFKTLVRWRWVLSLFKTQRMRVCYLLMFLCENLCFSFTSNFLGFYFVVIVH